MVFVSKFAPCSQRGLAPQREVILLDKFDEPDLERLVGLFARLAAELAAVNGDRERLVRRYADALRRIRAKVPAAARMTLCTTRHQFRANMARAGYSAAEIAAAMGHRSAQTNTGHYGRGNKGWPPVFGTKPIDVPAKLVARVRPGARAKAKAAAEDRAITSAGPETKTALLLSNSSSVRRDIVTDRIQPRPDSTWEHDDTLPYGSEIEHELNAENMRAPRHWLLVAACCF